MLILRIHTRIFSRSLGTDRNNMKHYVRLRRQDDASILRFLVRVLAPCIYPRLDNNRRRKITLLHKKKCLCIPHLSCI